MSSYALAYKGQGELDVGTTKRCLWFDGSILYVGYGQSSLISRLTACTFNGTTFSTISTSSWSSNRLVRAVYGDGTYIYLGTQESNGELQAFRWSNSTTLSRITGAALNLGAAGVNTIYCDSQGYIYVGCTTGYIYAYTFNGSTFTLRGSVDIGAPITRIVGDGSTLYVADSGGISALTFDGSSFSTPIEYSTINSQALYHDGEYIYAGKETGTDPDVRSLSFSGSELASVNYASLFMGSIPTIDGDGAFLYAAEAGVKIAALTHSLANGFAIDSTYSDSGVLASYYHSLCAGGGYIFYLSGNYVRALRMEPSAGFTVDKTRASTGEGIQFTLV